MAKTKRLLRSKKEKIIAGVCGGFAEYFSVDPVLVRLIFVAITLVSGILPGVLFYLIAWAIMPEK